MTQDTTNNPKLINEEMGIHKEWYLEAEKMTLEELPKFLSKLANDYNHDYGTICHAIAASGIAAMWAMNRIPQGGITGFQAGCIQWEVIKHWNATGLEDGEPARLIGARSLLFPQTCYKWTSISRETADWVKKKAEESLKKSVNESVAPQVLEHWKQLGSGWLPVKVVED